MCLSPLQPVSKAIFIKKTREKNALRGINCVVLIPVAGEKKKGNPYMAVGSSCFFRRRDFFLVTDEGMLPSIPIPSPPGDQEAAHA